MVELPSAARQEFEALKARKSGQNQVPDAVLAELEGLKQRKMVKNKGSDLLSQVQSLLKGITGGIASAGAKTALGAASLLPDTAGPGLFGEGINRLSKSGETPKQAMTAELQPIIDTFNKQFGDSSLAQGFSGAVEALPYLAGPGEVELPQGLASLASKAPRGLQTLTKMATGTLKAAPVNAGYGVLSYNPDKSTPEKALQGALIGTAFKGALSGLTGIASSASNTSKMILDALRTLKEEGVPVTASDVLGSGSILENFQKNVLPSFIGSGQATKFKNIINKVKGKAGDVINKLLGGEDMDFVLDNVISRIKGRFKEDSQKSRGLYDLAEKHIEENNIPYNDPITQELANKELSQLDEAVGQEGDLLENENLRKVLTSLAKPRDSKVFKYSKFGKSKLYNLMDEETDPYARGVYNRLYEARNADLKNIGEASGDKELQGLIKEADKFFNEDMAKYRDEDVKPFLYNIKTPHEAFRSFVKSSVTENPQFLEKFTKLLKPEDKSRIAAYMFKRAINPEDGTVNPGTFHSTWNNIGKRTKELLFNPEDRKDIEKISQLARLSKTARGAADTPNTGVTALRGLSSVASIASGGNALTSLITGNLHGAMASGLPFLAAPIAQEVINNPAFLKAIALLKQAEEKGLLKKSGAPALTNIAVRQ